MGCERKALFAHQRKRVYTGLPKLTETDSGRSVDAHWTLIGRYIGRYSGRYPSPANSGESGDARNKG